MQKAIEVLMGEHRLIEQALGSLETYGGLVRAGAPAERAVIRDYAAFLRGFADICHHGKEEEILFQRMVAHGFPQQAGPLAVMLHEHELGRRHVASLHALAEGPGALTAPEASVLLGHADAYVPLLRQHIQKEDLILYPLALQVLDAGELDAMNTAFEVFQARLDADGSTDRLRSLAEGLSARYRPDPVRMAEGSRLVCGAPRA